MSIVGFATVLDPAHIRTIHIRLCHVLYPYGAAGRSARSSPGCAPSPLWSWTICLGAILVGKPPGAAECRFELDNLDIPLPTH
jgi:hypothetical protein